eukprot:1189723-Prorocentrum_minimum.AAC.4
MACLFVCLFVFSFVRRSAWGSHPGAIGRRHLARVEIDDLLLDGALAEELLHVHPARVRVAHQQQDSLQHVADGVRRHLQRPDLVDVVALKIQVMVPGGIFSDRISLTLSL